MKIDVCLEMVFPDLPYEKRIEEIGRIGFKSVEFWFHDATFGGPAPPMDQPKDPAVLRQVCEAAGVDINNMVVNAPDGSFGGAPVNAADHGRYIERVHEVIEFAQAAGCGMAITCTGNLVPGLTREQMRVNLGHAYSEAAAIAQKSGFVLVLEPLNTLVDHAGYYLDSSTEGAEIVRAINSPNFKLLFDIYHMQIMQGNIISHIQSELDVIGHFHSAGVPGRHEIMNGELNYAEILKRIDAAGYKGSFGLEYEPSTDSAASLTATLQYIRGAGVI